MCRHGVFLSWLRRGVKVVLLASLAFPLQAREKDTLKYGEGFIVNIPFPAAEVAQAVEDVAENGIVRGTKEYNKDEYVKGAEAASSSSVFPTWTDPGQVFYKVRKQALSPWNFKGSNDVGTLAIRYVVQPQGENNTVLRINALFVEDFRHGVHASNGSVETSEYKDIQDHLAAIELLKKETAEAIQKKQAASDNLALNEKTELLSTPPKQAWVRENAATPVSTSSGEGQSLAVLREPQETPEQHLAQLRRQVERLVKPPGAPLRSAPFQLASTLKALPPGAEVLIVISTPYWFGVETHDGLHGWVKREQLEMLP